MGICSEKTIAKIKAQALNKVKLDALDKLKGGCLVVENAGLVKPEKLIEIVNLSAKDVKDFVVILTGEIDSISRLFGNTSEILSELEVKNKLDNLIMGMETGNLDRLIKEVDSALEKASKRDNEKKKVTPEDFN